MSEREARESTEYSMAPKPEIRREDEASAGGSAVIESLIKRQQELFASVEKYLPLSLLERLRAKALRERELLKESFEREGRRDAAKKVVQALHAAFFKLIRMEPHMLD